MSKEVTIARDGKVSPLNAKVSHLQRVTGTAAQKIRKVFGDLHATGISKVQPFTVGHVERRMRDYANANGITIADGDLYMSVKGLAHARRPSKVRDGIASSEQDIAEFPSKRSRMDLFYDGTSFVYTDYKNKFIIDPNYELKLKNGKTMKVNFVTAGIATDPTEFNNPRYRRV